MASRKGVTRRPAMVRPTKRRSSASRNSTSTLGRRASGEGRRVTPFLDAIVADSVSFEHFHANGAQTFHGLFASLCSSLPRQGTAATKARYANDYLCLPTLLTRGGYRTRMVIGQNRDRSHSRLGLFMARNGLDELIDEAAFPRSAPRMGLGRAAGRVAGPLAAGALDLSPARGVGRGEPARPHADDPRPRRAHAAALVLRRPRRELRARRRLPARARRVPERGLRQRRGHRGRRRILVLRLRLALARARGSRAANAAAALAGRILALYVTANALIEQNTLWSWREFGDRL